MSLDAGVQNKTLKSDMISAYSGAGYALFDVWINPEGKKVPVKKGWRKLKPDLLLQADDIQDFYGVTLRPQDLVIDADPRRYGPDGQGSLKEFCKVHSLPRFDTFVVRTASHDDNGLHVYLRLPPGTVLPASQTLPGYPGLEFKSDGAYVVGAGSEHPKTGRIYEVVRGSIDAVMDCPSQLLELLKRRAAAPESVGFSGSAETANNLDDAEISQAARAFELLCLHAELPIEGERNESLYKIALSGRDYGLSVDELERTIFDNFISRWPNQLPEAEAISVIRNAFQYGKSEPGQRIIQQREVFSGVKDIDGPAEAPSHKESEPDVPDMEKIRWSLDKTGALKPNIANVMNFFWIRPTEKHKNPLYGLLRYNSFRRQIELTRQPFWRAVKTSTLALKKSDMSAVQAWFSKTRGFDVGGDTLRSALVAIAMQREYNPVQEYLSSVKWDGEPRVERMLHTYCGAPNTPYIRAISKCTMVGACMRVWEPGCQHDAMLILEGDQDAGKSSFVKILGGDFSAAIKLDLKHGYKDTVQKTNSAWIIELAEMEFFRREAVESFKAFITTRTDDVRLPFEPGVESLPRQSIFIGTYNPNSSGTYLTDETGNRRFWPVRTSVFNLDALIQDRDQLWAEAMFLYNFGEKNYLTGHLKELAKEQQSYRTIDNEFVSFIKDYIANPIFGMTTENIAQYALDIPKRDYNSHYHGTKIGRAMRGLGYTQKQFGDKTRHWVIDLEDL